MISCAFTHFIAGIRVSKLRPSFTAPWYKYICIRFIGYAQRLQYGYIAYDFVPYLVQPVKFIGNGLVNRIALPEFGHRKFSTASILYKPMAW
jgi:hypothetical protein